MTAEQIHQIGQAWGKLVDRLTHAEDELMRRGPATTRREVREETKLQAEITSLKRRIERAERLMS